MSHSCQEAHAWLEDMTDGEKLIMQLSQAGTCVGHLQLAVLYVTMDRVQLNKLLAWSTCMHDGHNLECSVCKYAYPPAAGL